MRKILLYGELGNRFGREHNLEVRSAGEAIRAFCTNFPGFKKLMRDAHNYGVGFKVFVGHSSLSKEADVSMPSSEKDVIRVVPVILGSGALVKGLIGAALIAASILVPPVGVTLGSVYLGANGVAFAIGTSLALSGVYEALSGPPKTASDGLGSDVNGNAYIFDGPENVTRQGGCVPVGYGRMMVGSTVISAGIEDSDS